MAQSKSPSSKLANGSSAAAMPGFEATLWFPGQNEDAGEFLAVSELKPGLAA